MLEWLCYFVEDIISWTYFGGFSGLDGFRTYSCENAKIF
jgi:hypothetical protein